MKNRRVRASHSPSAHPLHILCTIACFAALPTLSTLPGCSFFASRTTPEVMEGPYTGPVLSIDRSAESPVLVMQAPTGGYTLTVDRVLERVRSHDVFATVRTPDPRFVHTQALVTHRAIIPLPIDATLRVCARIVPAGETPEDDLYPVAITADALTPAPTAKPAPTPAPTSK